MTRIHAYGPSLIVLVTTAAVLLAGPLAVRQITFSHTEATIRLASQRLEQNTILEQINQATRDIATMVEPSVVHISTEHIVANRWGGPGRKASSGSGWIFDEDGHIVTNHHVVDDAVRIEVQLHDGTIREASVVGKDLTTDIAVLRIQPGRLHPASRRDTQVEPVKQGDMVFAFGSPFDFRFSMSSGVVSGKGRSVGVIRNNRGRAVGYENFIQVDAAINPGNSGGPLTDFRGRVIGMNTAIATGRGNNGLDDGQFAGIGLAIPIAMIDPVVSQLIDTGVVVKGYLGVFVVDDLKLIREELRTADFDGNGVFVGHVDPRQDAADSGLRYADMIIAVNGRDVVDPEGFRAAVRAASRSDTVRLAIERYDEAEGRWARVELAMPHDVATRLRGVSLLELNTTVGEALDTLGFRGRGVRIARLEKGAPADRAGLRIRDVVTHVNEQPVVAVQQLRSLVSSIMPGDEVELEVWRYEAERDEGRTMTISVLLSQLDTFEVFGQLPEGQRYDRLETLGIDRMATSTPELADEWDVTHHPGVMILEMDENGELHELIEPGSIVVEVMEYPVRSTREFVEQLRQHRLADGVRIKVVMPDGQTTNFRVYLEEE